MSPLKFVPFFLLIATSSLAHDYRIGSLTLGHPWARATPPAAPVAGAYFTIINSGGEPDWLLAVSSPIAERIQVHDATTVDGVARMRQVAKQVIAPGETVVLKPGGLHLMLLNPSGPLREDERFPVTLVFENAGAITVEFVIQGIGSSEPSHEQGAPEP